MIRTNKECDSRRAYQCIKLVVTLSARCPLARDYLTRTQSQWQWSVEWLRGRMEDHSVAVSTAAVMSNEDSNTKNFQRTTSAQVSSTVIHPVFINQISCLQWDCTLQTCIDIHHQFTFYSQSSLLDVGLVYLFLAV